VLSVDDIAQRVGPDIAFGADLEALLHMLGLYEVVVI
jgi:hypothetical protein